MAPGRELRRPAGRLAPSPTGRLHLGHARSFLLAWWHARSRGGSVHLRLEDLDRGRVRSEHVEGCLEDLRWLGLDWDGPPRLQSQDTSAMEAACRRLLESGRAYPCVCTRSEIAAVAAPHAGEREVRYPGTCRGRWTGLEEARAATGREPALRLVVPEGLVEVDDLLQGPHGFDVHAEVGDFVLRRRDGAFAYQLAVVVDDAAAGVSEVVRGEDLLPSAARQALVLQALGLERPLWAHVPLVVEPGGERLAKRRGSLALAALRASGVDPRAVVAWAARTSGQDCGERAEAAQLLPGFDLARVPREPVCLAAPWV